MSFKKICICLILIFCIIGAASAAEDVSADVVDVADDSVAVDAVSDEVSDSLESVDDEAVVDESAPAQDDNDDVELEASVDDEPALDEVDDELSGQSHIVTPSIITKNILTSTSIEDILSDEVPSVLYVNESGEGGDGSGENWENAIVGKFALNNAISKIANNGVIYIHGNSTSFRGVSDKNYTIIGQDNTIITPAKTSDNTNGGIHTCVNLIFSPSTSFIIKIGNCDGGERDFINCTFKTPIFSLVCGNENQDSNGIMRFEKCIFENYSTFIDIGMHINATFNNCTFKNIEADSLIKITSNLVQYVTLIDCTFENCVMNGVVNLGMNVDPADYVAIENCNYDFDATVGVVSDENENYYLNATKLKPVPVDSAVEISSSEKGVVVIALTDNSSAPIGGATVKYTVNGGEEQTEVTGADGKFTITGLTGEVTIFVSYEGNESYNAISDTKVFNFTEEPASGDNGSGSNEPATPSTPSTPSSPSAPAKVATKLAAAKVTATYNVAKKLVIKLTDKNGKALAKKKVTVKVGSITKTLTTDKNGKVSLNIAKLAPKTYTAIVKFAGDSGYIASTLKPKVVVKKAKVKLAAKAKTFKVKAKTKKVKVTLKDNKGKVMKKVKLTLKIGKKVFKATTNKKGIATFKVKLAKKGKYTAKVKFTGNKYFKAASKNVKIKVKK